MTLRSIHSNSVHTNVRTRISFKHLTQAGVPHTVDECDHCHTWKMKKQHCRTCAHCDHAWLCVQYVEKMSRISKAFNTAALNRHQFLQHRPIFLLDTTALPLRIHGAISAAWVQVNLKGRTSGPIIRDMRWARDQRATLASSLSGICIKSKVQHQ